MRVFLSYAPEDREQAEDVASELRTRGVEVWLDRNLSPGSDLASQVQEQIATADAIVVLVSKSGLADPSLQTEVAAAVVSQSIRPNVKIIPILLDEGLTLPIFLDRYVYLDLTAAPDKHEVIERLATALGKPDENPPGDLETTRRQLELKQRWLREEQVVHQEDLWRQQSLIAVTTVGVFAIAILASVLVLVDIPNVAREGLFALIGLLVGGLSNVLMRRRK